jgi:DNA end-binding protein Ku
VSTREHVIMLEARGKGLIGTLLRYPYEVREDTEYFEDIPNIKIDKEMLDLAKHIVQTKSPDFDPEKFEDHYETAVRDLIKKKSAGEKIEPKKLEKPTNVINLMDALRQSIAAEGGGAHGGASSAKHKSTKKPAAHKAAKKARTAG